MVWQCGTHAVDLSVPQIMGIVNVTPDSFSDGGLHDTTEKAVAHGLELLYQGATILDVGGESTRPGSSAVSLEEELVRVLPVISELSRAGAIVSIDTRHAEVAAAAVEAGASIINDIEGFRGSAMRELAALCDAGLIIMHMQGTPDTMQNNPTYDDVVTEVGEYLDSRAQELVDCGVARERIMVDPGFGFGKTFKHNLELFLATEKLVALGWPYLAATSRKRWIGELTGIESPEGRDCPSAEIGVAALTAGAHMVRVHNVSSTVEALRRLQTAPCIAYIALGSNLGDREATLQRAIRLLGELPLTLVEAVSTFVESEPAYLFDQPMFINAVARVETQLGIFALFAYMRAIEFKLGRVKAVENGPRSIDLDLLLFGHEVCDAPGLAVPHPRLSERDFTVTPLLELEPNLVLPSGSRLTRDGVLYGHVRPLL